MLKVWGRKTSSNVQAAMWCIAELGLDYKRYDVGHRFGGTDTSEFLGMNPNGTIPVLVDGTNPPIWETGAILRYLANAYGSGSFWPEDLIARTAVDRWAEWAKINIAIGFTVPVFWAVVRKGWKDRDAGAIAKSVLSLERKLAIAEAQLQKHHYLAGPDFTLAVIQFGHLLYRYFDIEIERKDFRALAAYYERLTLRPAFAEHVMISYEDLRVD